MIIGPVTGFVPRPYQEHCINGGDPRRGIGIMPAFARYKRVLAVMATGTGKTELYLSIARRFLESPKTPAGKRVLILAHRDELVSQPIERAPRFGLSIAREQGRESGVGRIERVVASTIQSMEIRLKQYRPDEIGLVIIDEAHHGPAAAYGDLLEYFIHSYVLGVTATPERLDGVGLGEVFEACAFNYGIEEATEDGWLVPVLPKEVTIDGLDISKLRARMGDLPPGPLGELLAEYALPVAKHIVQHAGDRLTLIFCATVAHAHAQAEALRRYTSERVECLDGGTNKGIRAEVLADFKAGKVRYLTNAALFLEGMDAPKTSCVAIVRPTKSRGLVTQIVGRGTRALPGTVDRPELRNDPAARRAAIAASAKPNVLVLDFCAQVEQLGLVSVADVLAGKLTPEERLALGKLDICGDKTIDELTQEARKLAAVEAAAAAELSDSEATVRDIDPFDPANVLCIRDLPRDNPREARCSEKMAAYLGRCGIPKPETISASRARKLQITLGVRQRKNLASYPQQLALQKAGVPPAKTSRMFYETASQLLDALARNNWQRPRDWENDPRLGGRMPAETQR